jgi:protein-disulfide reductase (glutathione)
MLQQRFSPDGGYIPRAIFADAKGNLRTDIKNTMGNPKYAYFYSDASQVRNGMYMAIKALQSSTPGSRDEL